jgi:hypothetical protein
MQSDDQSQPTLLLLPHDILLKIFNLINSKNFFRKVAQVSKDFYRLVLMTLPAANYELPSSEQFESFPEYKRAIRFRNQVMFPEVNAARIELKNEGKFDNKSDVYIMDATQHNRIYKTAINPCGGPPNKSKIPFAPPINTFRFGVRIPQYKAHLLHEGHNAYHITASWKCLASILHNDFLSEPPTLNCLTNGQKGLYVSPSFKMWKLFLDLSTTKTLWGLWKDEGKIYEYAIIFQLCISAASNTYTVNTPGGGKNPDFLNYFTDWPYSDKTEWLIRNAHDDAVITGIHVWFNQIGNAGIEPLPCPSLKARVEPRLRKQAFAEKIKYLIRDKKFSFNFKRVNENSLQINFTAASKEIMKIAEIHDSLVEVIRLFENALENQCNLFPNWENHSLTISDNDFRTINNVVEILKSAGMGFWINEASVSQFLLFKPVSERNTQSTATNQNVSNSEEIQNTIECRMQ